MTPVGELARLERRRSAMADGCRCRRDFVADAAVALVIAFVVVLATAYAVSETRATAAEARRTRSAVCLLLDELGADASTPTEVAPCAPGQ